MQVARIYNDEGLTGPFISRLSRQREEAGLFAEEHDSRHLPLHQLRVVLLASKGHARADTLDRIGIEAATQPLHPNHLKQVKVLEYDLNCRTFSEVALVWRY